MDIEELRWTVSSMMPGTRADLEKLVSIPSVSLPGFPPEPLTEAANAVVSLLRSAGFSNARTVDVPGGYPTVFAEIPAPPTLPRSCCTRTTTSSLLARSPSGTRRRSSRRSAAAGYTAGGPQVYRPEVATEYKDFMDSLKLEETINQ